MAEGFRTFDHTGDLGLEVWAATPERLHALAAEALMAQVAVPRQADPEPAVRRRLSLEGDDPRDLLVHWLNTVLLESELQHAVWTRVIVESLTPTTIVATLAGPHLDSAAQVFLREIKAVSHHFLELDLEPPACRCRLILDI